jgi:hypothetical protein
MSTCEWSTTLDTEYGQIPYDKPYLPPGGPFQNIEDCEKSFCHAFGGNCTVPDFKTMGHLKDKNASVQENITNKNDCLDTCRMDESCKAVSFDGLCHTSTQVPQQSNIEHSDTSTMYIRK